MRSYLVVLTLIFVCVSSCVAATGWHHPFYLANDGYWRQRLRVDIHNGGAGAVEGAPAAVAVGGDAGEANLVGAAAESVRVVNADGIELLFAIYSPSGALLTEGPIPDGSSLVLPAVCEPDETVQVWAYFDNPSAWVVPDFLELPLGVRNGGVEDGAGATPTGWQHDAPDSQHQASWSIESPHSGSRCLKLWVASGAQPSWISTRQGGIFIQGGADYTLRGWVRTESISDTAGWYVHVGNASDPMLLNQSATLGAGTHDWTEVNVGFTAPADADRAELGTLLWGTGTAWFDDIALECSSTPSITATASAVETISVTETGAGAEWYDDNPADSIHWEVRAPVKVINLGSAPISAIAQVQISSLTARLGGRLRRDSIRVTDGLALVPHYLVGDSLLFQAEAAPDTAHTYHVYLSSDERIPAVEASDYAALLASSGNLVQNPSFEQGTGMPTGWTAGGAADVTLSLDQPGLFGARDVNINVPPSVTPSWVGWRQDVGVQPGKNYLYSAWVRTQDIANGSVQIHAHYRNASGELCETKQYAAAGSPLTGTNDWTLMSGVFTMPPDCVTFQLHLTMLATGDLWHDGVLLAEVFPAAIGRLECRTGAITGLAAWSVNPIVKVFQDDPPPTAIPAARISAARNEQEPLQLAVRSPDVIAEVSVAVDAPTDGGGHQLTDTSIAIVGYVPIDYPSSYYSSALPGYCRRYPSETGGSDGWAGLWPDYLLPASSFALPANTTQPVWITVKVPRDAYAGDYSGAVRLLSGAEMLATIPFTVHVWDFVLPDEPHAAAIYDIRLDPQWLATGQTLEDVRGDLEAVMSDHRLCPDVIQPDPVINYSGGAVTADFSAFDQAAEHYFNDLHLPHTYTPWYFYGFGWGMPPGEKWGEAPYPGEYPYDSADPSQLRPEYKTAYQACLQAYWDHMKAKGWADKVVMYLSDEPYYSEPRIIEQMKALCDMVHEVDPDIPIYVSTWQYVPAWQGYIDIWGIGHYGTVTPEQMAQLRAAGDRLRYTVDGQMCTDTPYLAVERLLPHYCFEYDVEAYEFWGVSWLTYNPYQFGWHSYIFQTNAPGNTVWVRYPNGDGYLAYPGALIGQEHAVSSIRMEQAREGQEDYEYLYLLKDLVDRAHAAGRDASAGEAALAMARALVTIPNAGGRYSTQILPAPDQVLEVKEVVAEAIEGSFRFSDVPPDHWAYPQIMACAQAGVVGGYDDGTYRPTLPVSRDQMAVFISRALAGGDDHVPTGPALATFSDVPTDHWAFKYVEYAAANTIVGGYDDGTYRPAVEVDRGQMAVFIARAIVTPTDRPDLPSYTPPTEPTFPDVATSHWAYRYIEYIAQPSVAITQGYDDGTYRPDTVVTRDQMAVYVQRAFDLPM